MNVLNVALVGYGFVGKVFHAPLITATPGLSLHTVISRDAGKVNADYPDMRVVKEPHNAFADPDIDLVVIASPNDSHAALALSALRHGKHVVVDKPFTVTREEAEEVVACAQQAGRLVSVFQNRRWDADFLALRGLVRDDALGEIAEFHSHFDRFRPNVQDRWREQDAPGGGLWYDLGPHLIDQALQLFGPPQSVQADLATQRDGGRAVDYFHVQLHYPRTRVHLHAGSLVPGNGLRFAVHGTRGSFLKYGMDSQEDALRAGGRPGDPEWGRDPAPGQLITVDAQGRSSVRSVDSVAGDYRRYYAAMRAAIVEGEHAPVSTDDALAVMRVLHAGLDSARQSRMITLA